MFWSLKQAKLFINQAKEDQQILVNEILYNASLSYFDWLKTFNEKRIYENFLDYQPQLKKIILLVQLKLLLK